ncbi:hypothetical protein [Maridesulfovibrio ferrireducens]|uniref:hypothetical protein n=1 Tax=Maridesulfovibrio ferrireducens TaxID=246191 RepID=UPI000A866023|nr:hypothetical protein [Maridesulfovibrio ferrireducens]
MFIIKKIYNLIGTQVDSTSYGSITLLISSYESSCTNYENEIYDESAWLDLLETSLTRKYAALDEMLSYYSNIESQLETSLASLE